MSRRIITCLGHFLYFLLFSFVLNHERYYKFKLLSLCALLFKYLNWKLMWIIIIFDV